MHPPAMGFQIKSAFANSFIHPKHQLKIQLISLFVLKNVIANYWLHVRNLCMFLVKNGEYKYVKEIPPLLVKLAVIMIALRLSLKF